MRMGLGMEGMGMMGMEEIGMEWREFIYLFYLYSALFTNKYALMRSNGNGCGGNGNRNGGMKGIEGMEIGMRMGLGMEDMGMDGMRCEW